MAAIADLPHPKSLQAAYIALGAVRELDPHPTGLPHVALLHGQSRASGCGDRCRGGRTTVADELKFREGGGCSADECECTCVAVAHRPALSIQLAAREHQQPGTAAGLHCRVHQACASARGKKHACVPTLMHDARAQHRRRCRATRENSAGVLCAAPRTHIALLNSGATTELKAKACLSRIRSALQDGELCYPNGTIGACHSCRAFAFNRRHV